MKNFYILFILLSFVSCKQYYFKKYQITNPKIETKESIKQYVEENFDTLTPPLIFFKGVDEMKRLEKAGLKLNDIYFFNDKGEYIEYISDTTKCDASNLEIILNNPGILKTSRINPDIRLKDVNALVKGFDNEYNPIKVSQGKYVVVISFMKYMGKLNNQNNFYWAKRLRAYPDIEVYLLNSDFLKEWGVKQEDLPKIK